MKTPTISLVTMFATSVAASLVVALVLRALDRRAAAALPQAVAPAKVKV